MGTVLCHRGLPVGEAVVRPRSGLQQSAAVLDRLGHVAGLHLRRSGLNLQLKDGAKAKAGPSSRSHGRER